MTTEELFTAAKNGDCDELRRLIKGGADVNQANWYGETALMWAASKGHSEAVKLLNTKQTRIKKACSAERLWGKRIFSDISMPSNFCSPTAQSRNK